MTDFARDPMGFKLMSVSTPTHLIEFNINIFS